MPPKKRRRRSKGGETLASKLASSLKSGDKEGVLGIRLFADDPRTRRTLSTGIPTFDVAIGSGGWPFGCITMIHGPQSTGKTTKALMGCARVQKMGGIAVFLDFENKLDRGWAEFLGVDTSSLVLSVPDHIEAAFDGLEKIIEMANKEAPDVPLFIVWDSLQSAAAKWSVENDYDRSSFSPEAAAYAGCWRKFNKKIPPQCIMVVIDQVSMDPSGFIAKEKYGVGRAVSHYVVLMIKMKVNSKRRTKDPEGHHWVDMECIKNQTARPYGTGSAKLEYGLGFDTARSTLDALVTLGAAKKNKSFWKVKGYKSLQPATLADDPDLLEELQGKVREVLIQRHEEGYYKKKEDG